MSSKIIAGTTSGTALNMSADTSGQLEIQTGSTPTTAITIDANQRSMFPTTIGVGGATPSTIGSGITFPATQSASNDANTLDDYEEGSWTPSITFGGGSTGITYNATYRTGIYTKIGSLVTASCYFSLTSKGSSTGQVSIGGLPFSNGQANGQYTVASLWTATVTNSGTPAAYVNPNGTSFVVGYIQTNGVFTQYSDTNFANNSEIMINFSYRTV